MIKISIAEDFSRHPAGRIKEDGPYHGTRFRNEFLLPHLGKGEEISVSIDGTAGYGSSFLEEAFGGLIREAGISHSDLKQLLKIECNDPEFKLYEKLIWRFIDKAAKAA